MAVEAYLPTLVTVVVTAAIDSINPCAIGVLILMISLLVSAHKTVKQMLIYGFAYIGAIYITYLLAGLGLLYFLANIPLIVTEYIALIIGSIIIIGGLLEIKDFFWYGQGPSLAIPVRYAKRLHKFSGKGSITSIMILGAFVAAIELPCTGAPYLAIITLLSQYFDFSAFLLMIIYNIIFVAPLIIILLAVAFGVKLHDVKRWKQENRGYMRLGIGLMLICMGWLLILIANGTINFG